MVDLVTGSLVDFIAYVGGAKRRRSDETGNGCKAAKRLIVRFNKASKLDFKNFEEVMR